MPIAAGVASKPGPRPSLSRDDIVRCALRLMDREGPEALTFRAVARELEIAVGTLSNYFPSLADLQDEVAAKVMSELRPIACRTKRYIREQLARFGMDLMGTTQAHPYLAKIHGPASTAVLMRTIAGGVKTLMQAGLDGERALAIFTVVTSLAHAWGLRDAIPRSPELQARIGEASLKEFEELLPVFRKFPDKTAPALYRRWFLLCIDGLLP